MTESEDILARLRSDLPAFEGQMVFKGDFDEDKEGRRSGR